MYIFPERMSENYAVVQFLIDETFSEISTNWVQKNESDLICWWPNTKNISSLIENRTEPDKNLWSTFDITVIKYCSSLASARKSAADAYYITTDDEKIGRGQRTLKMNKQGDRKKHEGKNYDDSNDESDKENDKNSNGKKKKSTKHLKQSINRPTFNSMPVYNPEKVKKICQSGEKSVVSVCASKNFEAEMLPSSISTSVNLMKGQLRKLYALMSRHHLLP
ncbi:PREDICTED: uncharacterized protein LOC105557630 [Vollenhovia emeryi]|uniref:uncharacterized protein LOC105557630 n=1 Tax=Vollenhovia emeryi TaxID=411798 RepID=UPI0005F3983F|nr:PREDICTED: uncharacterized protein LOC105557630 [Vollenhovia emeryi]